MAQRLLVCLLVLVALVSLSQADRAKRSLPKYAYYGKRDDGWMPMGAFSGGYVVFGNVPLAMNDQLGGQQHINEGTAEKPNPKRMGKSNRPSLQIYRPPGLRVSGRDQTNDQSKPSAAGSKQPISNGIQRESTDYDPLTSVKSASPKSNSSSEPSRPNSAQKVTSPTLNGKSKSPTPPSANQQRPKGMALKSNALIIKDLPKKRIITPKDIEEMKISLQQLQLNDDTNLNLYAQGSFTSSELAQASAQSLVQSAIEKERNSKSVARLCALVMECETGDKFHKGLVSAAWNYYECREILREQHFTFWLAFLNFISDLYATVGFNYEGELVDILFRVFDFMLRFPVLDTLKIEELECLITSLLSVGYDLERQCPDQLAQLRDIIRDALMHAHEPWARKMILLLVELSASGWKLPHEANDYYFQTAVANQNQS